MNFYIILYSTLLFILLTPGIILTLPNSTVLSESSFSGFSKYVIALVHGLIFSVIFYIVLLFQKTE